jgi:hypothetical protein
MSCSCTEDKFLYNQTTKTEMPWDGVAKGIIIGRNRVMCQECIDNNARMEKERKIQEIDAKLREIDIRSIRSARTKDEARMAAFEAEGEQLRAQRRELVN